MQNEKNSTIIYDLFVGFFLIYDKKKDKSLIKAAPPSAKKKPKSLIK